MNKKDILICNCEYPEHQIIIEYDDRYKEISFQFHLTTYRNFFKRLWVGLRYAFGYKSRYGNWDCIDIDVRNYGKLKDVVNYIGENDYKIIEQKILANIGWTFMYMNCYYPDIYKDENEQICRINELMAEFKKLRHNIQYCETLSKYKELNEKFIDEIENMC